MKVALCFSGKLGDWESSRDSIVNNLIRDLNPDIFFSTWSDEDYQSFYSYYKPKSWTSLDPCTPGLLDIDPSIQVKPSPGLIPMLANMRSAHQVMTQYESLKKLKYDIIIRLRPDIQVLERIKKHEIQDCIRSRCIRLPFFESSNIYNHEQEMRKIFSFSFIYDKASLPNQINDQFAIGHSREMEKYMLSINGVSEALTFMQNEGYPEYMSQVPESVLTVHLNRKNCKYKQLTGTNSFGNIKTILCKGGKKWKNQGHNSTIYNENPNSINGLQ